MGQLLVLKIRTATSDLREAAHDERTHEHACVVAQTYRADGEFGHGPAEPRRARSCRGRCGAPGRACGRCRARGVCARLSERGRDRFHRRPFGACDGAAAAGLGATGFLRSRSRLAFDERAFRARPRSALRRHGARIRCRECAAHRGRRARLRCAGGRGAGSLGAGPSARSRGEPQADAGRADLRRHRPLATDRREPSAFHRRNKMDRARGAFAAIAMRRIIACGSTIACGSLGRALF
jgi:hypothetical protein